MKASKEGRLGGCGDKNEDWSVISLAESFLVVRGQSGVGVPCSGS
ncbi:unnamed protein product [Schistosoma mattheei]|uniref:Uncharacterized protein n=1 Tax=Schistosoma mattheei TaxID=31246 RepID=A0A3P8DC88_9TREM|nr:unnamed protein product [Schistosoma mattheei]